MIYVGVMAVVFVLFFRDNGLLGIFAGLLVSGPLYLAFGYVLAKFGYQRKTWKELRSEPRPTRDSGGDVSVATRPKPAPTKRTGGGSGRPSGSQRKRR